MTVAADTAPIRVAGAPISWGVSEVPGWGHQLSAERVMSEMRDVGLTATEFGPDDFLPKDPTARADFLSGFGLQAVGGFVPVLLHDASHDPLPSTEVFVEDCLATGAGVMVLAAATGVEGYDDRPTLDDNQWQTLLANLDRIADRAAARGVVAVIHPHIGTMVQDESDVERVLEGSRIGLCLDTGHLAAAGANPVVIANLHAERIAHVHLKDVDETLVGLPRR